MFARLLKVHGATIAFSGRGEPETAEKLVEIGVNPNAVTLVVPSRDVAFEQGSLVRELPDGGRRTDSGGAVVPTSDVHVLGSVVVRVVGNSADILQEIENASEEL